MRNQSLLAVFVAVVVGFTVFFYTKKEKPIIRVQRTFNASTEKVWDTWSNPDQIKKWWGPMNFTAPVVKVEFHEGGSFLLAMEGLDGKRFWNAGRYREIIPQKHLKTLMYFSDENGNRINPKEYGLPGNWSTEVAVTVDFESADGKTTVKVREDGIPAEMAEKARMGWEQQFDKLEALLK